MSRDGNMARVREDRRGFWRVHIPIANGSERAEHNRGRGSQAGIKEYLMHQVMAVR